MVTVAAAWPQAAIIDTDGSPTEALSTALQHSGHRAATMATGCR
jgi:hypothetical protein